MNTYFIKTFGCQMNFADSERLAAVLQQKGMTPAGDIQSADEVYVNTCMVRQSAENRVYGLVNNLAQLKPKPKIVLTGCLVGLIQKDLTGKLFRSYRRKMPAVDKFLSIDQIGFNISPIRNGCSHAYVPISNGCNNFCSYCIVPYCRGREVSRPLEEIVGECEQLKSQGFEEVTLLGQNVNSYGRDLIQNSKVNPPAGEAGMKNYNSKLKIVGTKNFKDTNKNDKCKMITGKLGTEFPYLLESVSQLNFTKVSFLSSNPWDISEELIETIACRPNINREIHLPSQSGNDEILKRMNRPYTSEDYLKLVSKIREKIPDATFTTDIIVGFPGETEKQFQNTVDLVSKVGFTKAYISKYSPRPRTLSAKRYKDNISDQEKKCRWEILDNLIN